MRERDRHSEDEFFAALAGYLDLERNTSRSYSHEEYSLDRMPRLAELAGNPEHRLGILHVAGTKGKGSTCHFLAALLNSAGQRVGVFASPHLSTVRERFQIDGHPVDYSVLQREAESWARKLRGEGLQPGFFEVLVLLALRLFAGRACRLAVLETGIGGRLDATNYIPSPLCTAITPVSLDHTQLLGETIEEIAAEKAGILKPGVPLVLAKQPFPAAERVIRERATQLGVSVHPPRPTSDARRWLPEDTPNFLVENMAVALAVCDVLEQSPQRHRFRPPVLRGRYEIIHRDPLVMIDAAHNADSARRLARALRHQYPDTTWTIVLGVVSGKDIPGIVRELAAIPARFVLTNPRPPKQSGLAQLTAEARQAGLPHVSVPEIRTAADIPAAGPLLFTGSFFTALIGDELFGPDR